jgi:hypothetical protein
MDTAGLHQQIQHLTESLEREAWLENDSATVDRLMAPDYA